MKIKKGLVLLSIGAYCFPMPAAPPPFRLLSPAQFRLLTAEQKSDYLSRLTSMSRHAREFHQVNRRVVEWLLRKDDVGGR
jgi:hypothetical protein